MLSVILKKYRGFPIQVKASFWFLICAIMQRGILLITTPIFTRLFTTSEYGQFSVFSSWQGVITVIVSLNLYYGVYTQGMIKFEQDRNQYSSSLQGLTLTLILIWTAIYGLFYNYWNTLFSLTTIQMLSIFIMIWTGAVFTFWSVEQRVDFKYHMLVIITMIASILNPIISIIFILIFEDKVTARILAMVLVNITIYTWFFIKQMMKGKVFYSKKFWKYALTFNIPLLPHYLSQVILSNIDRIMISDMVSSDKAGIYNLAYSVSMLMIILNSALTQTIEPWMFKKIKLNQFKDITKVAYPSFIIVAVANLILIAFAPEIVAVFAPRDYYEAIWIIPPVAMSVYVMFFYIFFVVFEFYFEKTKYITVATTVGAVLNLVLNYYFIRIFGYYAAGYTTLICYIVYAIFHYYFMRIICKRYLNDIRVYDLKIMLSITIVFMLIGFLFLILYKQIIVRYLLILLFIVVLFMIRKRIIKAVKELLSVKNQIIE